MSFATSTRSLLHYFSNVEHYGADRSEHSPGVGYYHQRKGEKRGGGGELYDISHHSHYGCHVHYRFALVLVGGRVGGLGASSFVFPWGAGELGVPYKKNGVKVSSSWS